MARKREMCELEKIYHDRNAFLHVALDLDDDDRETVRRIILKYLPRHYDESTRQNDGQTVGELYRDYIIAIGGEPPARAKRKTPDIIPFCDIRKGNAR